MSAFGRAPPVEFAPLFRRSGQLALTDFPTVRLTAPPRPGWRRIAVHGVVRTTIALLVLTIGVSTGPFSFAQSRAVDPPRQEVGAPPQQFAFWRAGQADVAHWVVVGDSTGPGGTTIERSDTDRSVHNALAVYTAVSARNARIRTHFKLIAGSTPSAGLALRVTGPDDYYLVRASEDEQRVSLFHVVSEVSEEIAGVDADITRDHWQTLEVTARDNEFTIWLDDQVVLTVFDDSKLGAGQFGIWTERDDVTRFNQVEISPLPSGYERFDLQDRSGG
jgi:hypothetical protein